MNVFDLKPVVMLLQNDGEQGIMYMLKGSRSPSEFSMMHIDA